MRLKNVFLLFGVVLIFAFSSCEKICDVCNEKNAVHVYKAVGTYDLCEDCYKRISGNQNEVSETDIKTIIDTPYSNLSRQQKLTIIRWIENRYQYYDDKEGKYVGDKYTKTIFNEAASKYNKTYDQISNIWDQSYDLKYN